MKSTVRNYLNANPRNKLIIGRNYYSDLSYLNLGLEFAQVLSSASTNRHFPLKAKTLLDELLDSSVRTTSEAENTLAIENIGILFEPDLKVDFHALIDQHSKHNAIFLKWDGEIENDNLYFLTIENGLKINIKDISHIII